MNTIYEHLVDAQQNKSNLDSLIKEFDKDNFIPFIGAGCSVPLGEYDWKGLFVVLKDRYGIRANLSKNNGRINYPRSFANLYKKMSNKKDFYKDIFDVLQSTVSSWTSTHAKIIDTFTSYITTNFDTALDEAYSNQKKRQVRKYFFHCDKPESNLCDCIVYLHGHKDINFAILKESDYRYFYPTVSDSAGIPILESFLTHIYNNKNIIFIGCSFTDGYITSFFKYLYAQSKSKKHFLLLDEESDIYKINLSKINEYVKARNIEEAERQKEAFYVSLKDEMGIHIIVYKKRFHKFLEYLCDELNKISTKTDLKEYPISGVPS